jgi:hypothetical protein
VAGTNFSREMDDTLNQRIRKRDEVNCMGMGWDMMVNEAPEKGEERVQIRAQRTS